MKMEQNFDYRIYTAPVEFVTEIHYVQKGIRYK